MPDPMKSHHPDTIKRAAVMGVTGPQKPMGIDDVKPDPTVGLDFEPVGRRMLVRRADTDQKLSKGGIVMPGNADVPTFVSEIVTLSDGLVIQDLLFEALTNSLSWRSQPQTGKVGEEEVELSAPEVLALNLDPSHFGHLARFLTLPHFSADVGDLVIHSRHAGIPIKLDGEELRLLGDNEVLGLWRRPVQDEETEDATDVEE